METQKYRIEFEQVNDAIYSCPSRCNEITFRNTGIGVVTINKFPLVAGDEITFKGNFGEEDITVYSVENNVAGNLWVFRKIYQK